jgi:hypothetical protein
LSSSKAASWPKGQSVRRTLECRASSPTAWSSRTTALDLGDDNDAVE